MSIKLTKRVAAALLKRGVSSVRITPTAVDEAKKALTRDDVRAMIKSGGVYAIKEKKNLSLYSIALNKKRSQGRKRGQGKRRGSDKARGGVDYKKSIRAQRRVLKSLKEDRSMDNVMFKKLYLLVKGGSFPNKVTLLNRIRSEGIAIDDQKFEKLRHA
jgi:large subunit ribosomal protein L19e